MKKLQHRVTNTHEYTITANTGTHAITSIVSCPEVEDPSVLEWSEQNPSALLDIQLLFSLFTGREVFTLNRELKEGEIITSDPRQFQFGGILRTSIPYKAMKHNSDSYICYDIGFQESLNSMYELIKTVEWQKTYEKGYFLLLVKNAFKPQILETSFLLCWTIWEHLFTILNRSWMSDKQIRQIRLNEKISFLLIKFALTPSIDNNSRKRMNELSDLRNRLAHFVCITVG